MPALKEKFHSQAFRIYGFLAFPAHLWLYGVAWLCGMTFRHGPVDEDGEMEDY